MARFEISGLGSIISGLWDMVESTPQLRHDILEAEADVIEPLLKRSIVDERLVRTGKLSKSIVRTEKNNTIRLGPSGVHHLYTPSGRRPNADGIARNGHIGYIHEFGVPHRGIPARKWMEKAVEKGKSAAYVAADKVYYSYLDKHNL